MSDEELYKSFREKMFELRLKQAYYVAEHKKDNPKLTRDIIALKRSYAKALVNERKGDVNNVEHKRK